jgi:formate--tetrahydrofolate ligase
MPSSSEIALRATLKPITQIAKEIGLTEDELIPFGHSKAKIDLSALEKRKNQPNGKLILVTAMTPTKYGEGKTTTTIGLGQAFGKLKRRGMVAIRQPSLGPIFGIKGGATGAGYAQVMPMEEINLHFTGDFAAIEKANNLLAALIDNHMHHNNTLGYDVRKITFKRCFDMNDRALRQIVIGLGGTAGGVPREAGFQITAASEVMAILGLSTSLENLEERLGRIVTGYSYDNKPILANDLKGTGSMAVLLKDAILPNLVQTLENTPALVHTGPFGNIAHGTSSVVATQLALKLADYVVTEAGFASDLGAEKFFNIKCRVGNLSPSATVLVATIRALKLHGGVPESANIEHEDPEAVQRGLENLEKHIENIGYFGLPLVVAINQFPADSPAEIRVVQDFCKAKGVECAVSQVVARGGEGGVELAEKVIALADSGKAKFHFLYEPKQSFTEKIEVIAKKIYGADGVNIEALAKKQLQLYEKSGYGDSLVCIAKTQSSLSDNPKRLGRPTGFRLTIRDVELSAGAGFIVPLAGEILRMPGLPAHPAAEGIHLSRDAHVEGLSS